MDGEALSGTAYIELLPGPYQGECWREGSLFFSEERFGYIEPLIQKHLPGYDHYAFTEGDRAAWTSILGDLEALRGILRAGPGRDEIHDHVGFFFGDSEGRFAADLEGHVERLVGMIVELEDWIRRTLRRESVISVLGI